MAINYESSEKIIDYLKSTFDFSQKRVIDIGCGNGDLTLALAQFTQHSYGIDPDGDAIIDAKQNVPNSLARRIEFATTSVEDYEPDTKSLFDAALYLWSL